MAKKKDDNKKLKNIIKDKEGRVGLNNPNIPKMNNPPPPPKQDKKDSDDKND